MLLIDPTAREARELATLAFQDNCPALGRFYTRLARRLARQGDNSYATAQYEGDEWQLGVETGGSD